MFSEFCLILEPYQQPANRRFPQNLVVRRVVGMKKTIKQVYKALKINGR